MKYRPTREDKAIIRACAVKSSGFTRIKVEPGIRQNIKVTTTPETSMNVALISSDPEGWNDTDLYDMREWSDFVAGFDLTPDGRGIVDFYVYSIAGRGDYELETNVDAYWENGELVKVTGTGSGTMWTKEKGYSFAK